MSKKRFSDGLDDLLHDSNVDFSAQPVETAAQYAGNGADEPAKKRTSHHKNFISDLDFLLNSALDEMEGASDMEPSSRAGRLAGKQAAPGKSKSSFAEHDPSLGRRIQENRTILTGLDALIRRTAEADNNPEMDAAATKRLSVVVEKEILDKLKTIARMENSFMKDILSKLIYEYVEKYVKQKGVDIG